MYYYYYYIFLSNQQISDKFRVEKTIITMNMHGGTNDKRKVETKVENRIE